MDKCKKNIFSLIEEVLVRDIELTQKSFTDIISFTIPVKGLIKVKTIHGMCGKAKVKWKTSN